MVSFDPVNLYTNVPVDKLLELSKTKETTYVQEGSVSVNSEKNKA